MKKLYSIKWLATMLLIVNATVVSAQCVIPTALSASVIDSTTMLLTWTGVAGDISYDINVQSGPGNPEIFNINDVAAETSYTISGLNSGATYKFKVRSNCGVDDGGGFDHSSWSAYYTFTAGTGGGTGSCGNATGLIAVDISTSGATLNWAAVAGATSYTVRVEDGSGNPVDFLLTANAATNSYAVTGLNAGSNYKFKVRVKCGSIKSAWSAWKNFSTAPLRLASETIQNAVLFPNPANNTVTFVLPADGYCSIRLIDLSGKIILEENVEGLSGMEHGIQISDLPSGLYQVVAQKSETQFTSRLMVTH
ncbi:MAG: fibronectin type III domain-containing protein [Chitinophagales bacterium]